MNHKNNDNNLDKDAMPYTNQPISNQDISGSIVFSSEKMKQVGPFFHSERTGKPNTLPHMESFTTSNINAMSIIQTSHILYLFVFMAVYLLFKLTLGIFISDLIFVIGTVVMFFIIYQGGFSLTNIWDSMTSNIKPDLLYPISAGIFILVFYVCIYVLGIPMTPDSKPISIMIMDNVAWLYLFVLLIESGCSILFHVDVIQQISKFIHNNKTNDEEDNNGDEEDNNEKEEVFNVSKNDFTFGDAQEVCSSLNSRLATYDEIENAYQDGGEWCNYGWSEGQMALFPTQKNTWASLQSNPMTANKCGRPGINGGFMRDSSLKFGVNCYGVRPPKTDSNSKEPSYVVPKTPDEIALDEKTKTWREHSDIYLKLNSFNRVHWSEND